MHKNILYADIYHTHILHGFALKMEAACSSILVAILCHN
jgi:acyl transferase domain-containing protein